MHVARRCEKKNEYKFWKGNLNQRNHFDNLDIDAKMNLKRKQWEKVDWMNVAQDTYDWRAVVNTVLNLGISGVGDVLRSENDNRNIRKKQQLPVPTRVQSVTRQCLFKTEGQLMAIKLY